MAVLLLREAAAYVLAVDGLRPGEGLRLVALLKAAAAAAAETFEVHRAYGQECMYDTRHVSFQSPTCCRPRPKSPDACTVTESGAWLDMPFLPGCLYAQQTTVLAALLVHSHFEHDTSGKPGGRS